MPSLAVDRNGDMALGYTKSNSATNPQIKYAGRFAGDAANTFSQTEQTLIDGAGTQSGNCGCGACSRWGDYSGMALDPNGARATEPPSGVARIASAVRLHFTPASTLA